MKEELKEAEARGRNEAAKEYKKQLAATEEKFLAERAALLAEISHLKALLI